ncbi:MAG: hypothetical protein ACREJO_04455 [Phycisphaerales bacterium]
MTLFEMFFFRLIFAKISSAGYSAATLSRLGPASACVAATAI